MPIQPGNLIASNQQHGLHRYPNKLGVMFAGGNQAVVATPFTAGLGTTYTGGLMLYNPVASTVHLSILQVGFGFVVAQTNAAMIGLGVAQSTSALGGTLTVVPNVNQQVGNAATATGVMYSSASITLPAALTPARNLTVVGTGALTVSNNGAYQLYDIWGGIELLPGGYCCFTSSAAGTASSFFGGFVWEEIPSGS
jgi:hypothetical protein